MFRRSAALLVGLAGLLPSLTQATVGLTYYVPTVAKYCANSATKVFCPNKTIIDAITEVQINVDGVNVWEAYNNRIINKQIIQARKGILVANNTKIDSQDKLILNAKVAVYANVNDVNVWEAYNNRIINKQIIQARRGILLSNGTKIDNADKLFLNSGVAVYANVNDINVWEAYDNRIINKQNIQARKGILMSNGTKIDCAERLFLNSGVAVYANVKDINVWEAYDNRIINKQLIMARNGMVMQGNNTKIYSQSAPLVFGTNSSYTFEGPTGAPVVTISDTNTNILNNLQLSGNSVTFPNEAGLTGSGPYTCTEHGGLGIVNNQLRICKPVSGSTCPCEFKLLGA